jgi:hypothetical protein
MIQLIDKPIKLDCGRNNDAIRWTPTTLANFGLFCEFFSFIDSTLRNQPPIIDLMKSLLTPITMTYLTANQGSFNINSMMGCISERIKSYFTHF